MGNTCVAEPGSKAKSNSKARAKSSLLNSGVSQARVFELRLKNAIITRDLATLATLLPNATEKDLNSLEDSAENTRRLHSFPLGWAFTPSPKEAEQPFTSLNASVVRALVEARADITGRHSAPNADWRTPLEVAIRNWSWDPLAARTALELGAPIDQPAARPPILQASNPRILSLLLESGASMTQELTYGLRLPIMYLESYLPKLPSHEVMEKDASHFDRIMEDLTMDRSRSFNLLIVLLAHGLNTNTERIYVLATEAQRAVKVPGMEPTTSASPPPQSSSSSSTSSSSTSSSSSSMAEATELSAVPPQEVGGTDKKRKNDTEEEEEEEEEEEKEEEEEAEEKKKEDVPKLDKKQLLTFFECAQQRVSEWVAELTARQTLHSSYSMTYNPSELDPARNGFLDLVRLGAKHAAIGQHLSRMNVDPSARMAEAKAAAELAESAEGATARAVAEADRVARIVDAHEAAERAKKAAKDKKKNTRAFVADAASASARVSLKTGAEGDVDSDDDDDDDAIDVDVPELGDGTDDGAAAAERGGRYRSANGLAYAAVGIELTEMSGGKQGGDNDE